MPRARGLAGFAACRLAGFADSVDGGAAWSLQRLLDAAQPLVDRAPARVDQVDEEPEVVDARTALGEQLGLDALQSADRLVCEPAHLGQLAREGSRLEADTVADGVADAVGQGGFELRGGRGQLLDLGACAFQRGLDIGRLRLARGDLRKPLARAIEGAFVHGSDDSVSAG